MLPQYEDTPNKDEPLSSGTLFKNEAAEYLGIKENDLLSHIRQGRLVPINPSEEVWRFEIQELDKVARWYDGFRRTRRLIALSYCGIGLILATVGLFGTLCWDGNCEVFPRLLYCFALGILGLSLRAHRLVRENLSSPYPDYFISYPFIVAINAFAIVAVFSLFEASKSDEAFLIAAVPVSVVLALYAHPEHWILPRWLIQGRRPGS